MEISAFQSESLDGSAFKSERKLKGPYVLPYIRKVSFRLNTRNSSYAWQWKSPQTK